MVHNREHRGLGKPETFNFLGFTLICGRTRQGVFQLKRKTRRDRSRAKLQEIKEELRRRRHYPIPQQGQWLQQVVRGFFAYHAVPTNMPALVMFRRRVTEIWWRTLKRRSQRDKTTWQRAREIADDWLPKPKILHPWPSERFAVKHPRWVPYAGCVRRSWYEPASANLVRPKPSKQDGSESYGRHGNVGSGA
ncbi:MAG TPA: hypothetical protein VGH38_06910 [Bryobacteraceae bacterium]